MLLIPFAEDSAERADVAENQLGKLRAKNRSTVSANRSSTTVSVIDCLHQGWRQIDCSLRRMISVRQLPPELPRWSAVALFVHVKHPQSIDMNLCVCMCFSCLFYHICRMCLSSS